MNNGHNLAWKSQGCAPKRPFKRVIGAIAFGFGEILKNQTGSMLKGGDRFESIRVTMLETGRSTVRLGKKV